MHPRSIPYRAAGLTDYELIGSCFIKGVYHTLAVVYPNGHTGHVATGRGVGDLRVGELAMRRVGVCCRLDRRKGLKGLRIFAHEP